MVASQNLRLALIAVLFVGTVAALGQKRGAQQDGPLTYERAKRMREAVDAEIAVRMHDPLPDRFGAQLDPVEGKGGSDISGPYQVVSNWPIPLHSDWRMAGVAGLIAESPDRIYVAARGELPHLYERGWAPENIVNLVPTLGPLLAKIGRVEHVIMVFDRDGKLIESWEHQNDKIKSPNRILANPYDPEHHVWVVDQGGAGVLKFSHDGKELGMQITGKDVPPNGDKTDNERFNSQDAAFMPNGDFYVIANTRVIKFSKDGKYLSQFGHAGKGPGEFSGLHGIAIDHNKHRIYLGDKGNSRIQIVDEDGKYIDQWPNILYPMNISLTKDGRYLWVSDGYEQKFLKFDLNGKLLTSWGTFGVMPGAFWGMHYFTTDSEGNLYVAEDYGSRIQKFRPRKDGNPEQLIGQLQ